MRYVVVAVLLSGCASWDPIQTQKLANYESRAPKPVLVVVPGEAYEMYLVSSDDTTLRGQVEHVWTVTRDGAANPDEGPQALAKRLQWTPHETIPDKVDIPLSSVQFAREKTWGRKTVPIIVVAGAATIIVTFFLASQFLDFSVSQ